MIKRSKNLMNNSKNQRNELRYMFHQTDQFELFEQKNSIILPVELSPNKPVLAMKYKIQKEIQRKIQYESTENIEQIENSADEKEKNFNSQDEDQDQNINTNIPENSQEETKFEHEERETKIFNKEEEIKIENAKEEIKINNDEIKIKEEKIQNKETIKINYFEEEEMKINDEKIKFSDDEDEIKFSDDEDEIKFSDDEKIKFSDDEKIKFSDDEDKIKFINNEEFLLNHNSDNFHEKEERKNDIEKEETILNENTQTPETQTKFNSSIKENVAKQGGNINGVLRFSIQWNDLGSWDRNDLDAHCIEPNGNEIMYKSMKSPFTMGVLDTDVKDPIENVPSCENIVWKNMKRMKSGIYKFFVRNYEYRNGHSGFRAEIQVFDKSYYYDYRSTLKNNEDVYVAEVTLHNKKFSIKHLLNCV